MLLAFFSPSLLTLIWRETKNLILTRTSGLYTQYSAMLSKLLRQGDNSGIKVMMMHL